jgi:hypothetical protein
MNLSNISALAISIPIENLPEKIVEIQTLRFAITSVEPDLNDRIRIVAKLIQASDPIQSVEELQPLLDELMKNLQLKRSEKRNPYVW